MASGPGGVFLVTSTTASRQFARYPTNLKYAVAETKSKWSGSSGNPVR